jgi:DNA-binding MarR family transcriptional regulator
MEKENTVDRVFLRALRFSLVASRGGPMRGKILKELCVRPMNPLALAKELGIDYKTATHHLDRLLKQNLVTKKGDAYGAQYHVTFTPPQRAAFEEIVRKLGEGL